MTNFDGIEFDIRLTQDKKLVIYHDPNLPTGEQISNIPIANLEQQGLPTLEQFFALDEVVDLSTNTQMYIELKPDCNGRSRLDTEIADQMLESFQKVVETSSIDTDSIKIISFSKDMLEPFTEEYPAIPIIPDINECSPSLMVFKALPKFFYRSLGWHMDEAVERGFTGVFFARQYLMGWMSFRHPSYDTMLQKADKLGLELGTNLGTPLLEDEYSKLVKFSDKLQDYPRHGNGDGIIVAHRGTGTKGVDVPEDDIPKVAI